MFVDEDPISLQMLLGRFLSPAGWVSAIYTPDSLRVDGFYMMKEDAAYNVDSPFKFELGVSTVALRREMKKDTTPVGQNEKHPSQTTEDREPCAPPSASTQGSSSCSTMELSSSLSPLSSQPQAVHSSGLVTQFRTVQLNTQ